MTFSAGGSRFTLAITQQSLTYPLLFPSNVIYSPSVSSILYTSFSPLTSPFCSLLNPSATPFKPPGMTVVRIALNSPSSNHFPSCLYHVRANSASPEGELSCAVPTRVRIAVTEEGRVERICWE